MTDTDVRGRLPAQPSTTDLNLWLVSRLKGEGSKLTFGQIASIAKDLSAALRSPGGDGELVAAGREFLESVEALLDWMNGNDLSADHADAKPEDFERLCNALEAFTAALSAAEATSAPTPAPVSVEREYGWREKEAAERILEILGFSIDGSAHRVKWVAQALEQYATALRTSHGLPGEEELIGLIRTGLTENWKDSYNARAWDQDILLVGCHAAKYENPEQAADNLAAELARAILSRLTASREDV